MPIRSMCDQRTTAGHIIECAMRIDFNSFARLRDHIVHEIKIAIGSFNSVQRELLIIFRFLFRIPNSIPSSLTQAQSQTLQCVC